MAGEAKRPEESHAEALRAQRREATVSQEGGLWEETTGKARPTFYPDNVCYIRVSPWQTVAKGITERGLHLHFLVSINLASFLASVVSRTSLPSVERWHPSR